ncbi:MAG: TldD/PmbA family protein [Planctomycetota bacterium]|jgi:PmbA protein
MEKLLEMAKAVSDQAELFIIESASNSVSYINGTLDDVSSSFRSGFSLRIISEGKLGFAYTRNLTDREEFLNNAVQSLGGGADAGFDMPSTSGLPSLSSYDDSIEQISSDQLAGECEKVSTILQDKTDAENSCNASTSSVKTRIMNTSGTDVNSRNSYYNIGWRSIFPGSAAGIGRSFSEKTFKPVPGKLLDESIRLFNASLNDAKPGTGRMKILFMPGSLYTLTWRLTSGTSAKSIFEGISPVASKKGEAVISDKVTLYDDPLDDSRSGARSFDDEGTACRKTIIYSSGVLENFYNDLYFASKTNSAPSGHGFRAGMWGGDPLAQRPSPNLTNMRMGTGDKNLDQIIASIDKGIIVEGVLGAHSGNIPNGDYSVGINSGLYVENGEILGRVKDTMIAGNVYQTLSDVVEVGDTLYPGGGGYFPVVLCDNVSVSS